MTCERNNCSKAVCSKFLEDHIPTGLPEEAEGGCDDGIALEGLSKSRTDS